MMIKMDLTKVFKANVCTFEVAKLAAAAGMTPANCFFSYDSSGSLGDGAWLGPVTGQKFYPAVNSLLALYLATEETTLKLDDPTLEFWEEQRGDFFMFNYQGYQIKANNFCDLCLLIWIKYKHPDQKPITGKP